MYTNKLIYLIFTINTRVLAVVPEITTPIVLLRIIPINVYYTHAFPNSVHLGRGNIIFPCRHRFRYP